MKIVNLFLTVSIIFIINIFCNNILLCQNSKENDIRFKKAKSLMEENNFRAAAEIFDEMLQTDPNDSVILYNAALCELYSGRPDEAIQRLRSYFNINSKDADALNLRGLALERLGNIESAIKDFSEAIKLEKNFYEAYFNRGRCYYSQKKMDSAKADLDFAKKNDTVNPELFLLTGQIYFEQNDFKNAIADFKKIEKYKSNDAYYLFTFAGTYFKIRDFQNAINYYTKLLNLKPEDVSALNNRAICYSSLDSTEKAEKDRELIAEIQKKNGFNPALVNFRKLVSADKFFTVDIPENWRTFSRTVDNINEIAFFNPEFSNILNDSLFRFSFGGQIFYYSNFFQPDTSLIAAMQQRDAKQNEHRDKRQTEHFKLKNYGEVMRKTYNPNEKLARELSRYKYFSSETEEYFYGIEYFIVTTSGKLIFLYLQIPEKDFFYYQALLDRIQESLKIIE